MKRKPDPNCSATLPWRWLVLFLVGAMLGIAIVPSALHRDRKARPHEERDPR